MTGQPGRRTAQNIRNFTVKICNRGTHEIVGTGVVVSRSGRIATCAHVVLAAGVLPRTGRPVPGFWSLFKGAQQAGPGEVEVRIPGSTTREAQTCRATLLACFPDHDDDVVLLQLAENFGPLSDDEVAVVGAADGSAAHPFRSYGYRRLDTYSAGWADGKILGPVEAPEGRDLKAEPIQLESDGINRGMSGAAVLDMERNLVVGLVCETWFPDQSMKDQRTAWAVDATVLHLAPFDLPLGDAAPDSVPLPEPETLPAAAAAGGWIGVPPAPEFFVGRDDLLDQLTGEWSAGAVKLTSIVGFGGEGKSALVRRWLDVARPGSVFWWTFSDSNLDAFFDAAVQCLGGVSALPKNADRAHLLAALLTTASHVLVLDGLEAVQFQGGDCEGLLKNQDLARFLRYAASPSHPSFCVLTSRMPVADLIDLPACRSHSLRRLTTADGSALLHNLGVSGDASLLDQAAEQWDGHALTLYLLGTALRQKCGGDPASSAALAAASELPRDQRVDRILAFYDEDLDDQRRQILQALSLLRIPPAPPALAAILHAPADEFQPVFDSLTRSQIVRLDPEGTCSLHPLVRQHYEPAPLGLLAAHLDIARYYMALAPAPDDHPALRSLSPHIEAVHHLCRAGCNIDAHRFFERHLMQGDRKYLLDELCAAETVLDLVREIYFPDGDITQDPLPDGLALRSRVLNRAGACLLMLGRLREAVNLFQRASGIGLGLQDWHNSSADFRNLTNALCSLGEISAARNAAAQALELSRLSADPLDECRSLAWQAWVEHLNGNLAAAGDLFERAAASQAGIRPEAPCLVELRGVQHATHLRRIGQPDRARAVAAENLRYVEELREPDNAGACHVLLGDLDADAGAIDTAERHYADAIRIAREVNRRDVLLLALASRSAWLARSGSLERALRDVAEGLALAVPSEFRIAEADLRAALAAAHLRAGDRDAARAQARRAREICDQTGYFWARDSAGR